MSTKVRKCAFLQLGLALALALLFFAQPRPALAYGCAVPNIFKAGHNADANQVNANFSALVQCLSFLDATNVTGALYASNFKPTTVGQATFGSGQDYRFPGNLSLLGATIGGCAYLDTSGRVATAVDGANHPLLCLPGGLIPIAQGGTGVAGGWATGKCFYLTGSVFAQRGCGPFAPAASLPIVVGATPPPTPTPGPTPTPAPPLTAMVERQTTITRVQNCPNIQTPAGCSIDLYPIVFWSTVIAYRFYQSTDGGNTWTFTNEDRFNDADQETPTGGTGPPGPDCTEGSGVTYSYCPSGTWTPSAPPGTTGLNFGAPFGAAGQTPPPPTPTPAPTPTPVPTPTPTPLPTWLAQYSLAAPLAQTYGGTHATGSAWASPAPPLGDALGSNGTTVTWLSLLPSIDNNGAACQSGSHPGTPYCVGIAPATYTWTGIPISLAGGSCAIVTSATQAPCATINLNIPVYPVTGLAALLSPYRPAAGNLQTDQINDGAVLLFPLQESTGAANAANIGSLSGTLPSMPYVNTVSPGGGPALWSASPRSAFFNQGKVGTNSFVYNPNGSHFTIEAVIRPTTSNSCGQIAGNNYDFSSFGHCSDLPGPTHGYALRIGNPYNGLTVGNGSTSFTTGGPTWTTNATYLVDGVFTGTQVLLYVNGVLTNSVSFTGSYQNSTGVPWTIGSDQNVNNSFSFFGDINNVANYDVALTAGQVAQHYADLSGTPTGIPMNATCLVREEDSQYPMFYAAQWLGGSAVSLNVWNSTGHAMAGAYTATVGLACFGSWVNGF